MKVAILGSTGFLGSSILRKLVAENFKSVNLLVRDSNKLDQDIKDNAAVKVFQGDIRDKVVLTKCFDDCQFIFHLGSSLIPSTSWDYFESNDNTEIVNLKLIIDTIVNNNRGTLVYFSSAGALYSSGPNIIDEYSDLAPYSPYGLTKLYSEELIKFYNRTQGLKYVIYRPTNIYGPGLNKPNFGVINTWINKVLRNEEVHVFGSLQNKKDFVYIDDFTQLVFQSFTKTTDTILNISSGKLNTLAEVLECLKEENESDTMIRYDNRIAGDISITPHISNEKIISLVDSDYQYTPLNEGIRKTIKSITSKQKQF